MRYEELKRYLSQHQFTWLITGVAGFIGSNLLEALLKLNQKVVGIDNFSTGHQRNIEEVLLSISAQYRNNFRLYTGDICRLKDCTQAMQGVDYVLYHAALTGITDKFVGQLTKQNTNDVGFINMLRAANDGAVKRFIYASSCAVYGNSPIAPKQEEHACHPLSLYASIKLANENYAKKFSLSNEIETIGLRYFNVFGTRQDLNIAYDAVIPLWIKSMLNNKPIFINGDGETTRDFCYIDDAIQANLLAAFAPSSDAVNTIYNIAVGEQTSLNALIDMIFSIIKVPENYKINYREFRPGDIRYSWADINKAKEKLGYMPIYKVYDGLKASIDWYIASNNV